MIPRHSRGAADAALVVDKEVRMQTFSEIRNHEVRERYKALLYLVAFLIATAVVIASVTITL